MRASLAPDVYLDALRRAIDDAQLIGRTLAGEPAAFGELVLRYQDRLYNSLLRLVQILVFQNLVELLAQNHNVLELG